MAETGFEIPFGGEKAGVNKYLPFAGAFVVSYLIICVVMYFALKDKYEEKWAQLEAEADSARVAALEDTTAAVIPDSLADTTAAAVVDTALAAVAEEVPVARREAVPDTGLMVQVGEPVTVDSAALVEQARRLKQLVNIMDKMKPQQTANIISKLDDDFAVEILLRLRDRNAAKVMSALPISRAARLSEKITRRLEG